MSSKNSVSWLYVVVVMTVVVMGVVSCEQTRGDKDAPENAEVLINLRDLELELVGIGKDVNLVRMDNVYPMLDPFHKVYEPSKNVKFPEGEKVLDIRDVKDEDISAVYYPIVSKTEKDDFYNGRHGEGRPLKIKAFVRQTPETSFDKRLIRNDYWYPYSSGMNIKGVVKTMPKLVLEDFKYWEESSDLELPAIVVAKNPILIDLTSVKPIKIDNYDINIGVVVEQNSFLNPADLEKGLNMSLEYAMENGKGLLSSDRQVRMILKKTNKLEDSKYALSQLYEDNRVLFSLAFTTAETARELVPIAKKYKRLLFVDSDFNDMEDYQLISDHVYCLSLHVLQRAKALAHSVQGENAKVSILMQDSKSSDVVYNTMKKVLDSKNQEIESYIKMDKNSDEKTYAEELTKLHKKDITHLVIFENNSEKDTTEICPLLKAVLKNKDSLDKNGIKIVSEIPRQSILDTLEDATGIMGTVSYHHKLVNTHLNDFIVDKCVDEDSSYPSDALSKGFTGGYIVLSLIQSSNGNFDLTNLSKLMENKEYITSKGFVKFRKEDNLASQLMYMGVVGNKDSNHRYTIDPLAGGVLSRKDTNPPIIRH